MTRIAIFGGTFDPIHIGHLAIAEGIIVRSLADRIIFMPAYLPPHKGGRLITDANTRLKMVKAAVSGSPCLEASDYEIGKGSISFTIETLDFFRATRPRDDISFIMGGDSAFEITTWKEYKRLVCEYSTVVVSRPGFDIAAFTALIRAFGFAEQGPHRYENSSGRSITIVDDIRYDISATQIRDMIGRGMDVSGYVPPGTLDIVLGEKLYR